MHADEAAESVSCPPSAILSLLPSQSRLRFPSLASAPTCLVYPFNTSLSNRLLHFAVCCSCNIVPRPLLSRSPPTRLSFRRADARLGESIDLRDSIVETRSPEIRARSIGLSPSRWPFLQLSPVVAKRKSAARSLNRRSYCAIVEELIKEITWFYASHE